MGIGGSKLTPSSPFSPSPWSSDATGYGIAVASRWTLLCLGLLTKSLNFPGLAIGQ